MTGVSPRWELDASTWPGLKSGSSMHVEVKDITANDSEDDFGLDSDDDEQKTALSLGVNSSAGDSPGQQYIHICFCVGK